jgi:hypothetical protein
MTNDPQGLNDPGYAAFAWARFRRMMAWMGLASAIIVAGAIGVLEYCYGPLNLITILAAIGGFGGTAMMTAALMGLVFLSSGSGHDEDVQHIDEP